MTPEVRGLVKAARQAIRVVDQRLGRAQLHWSKAAADLEAAVISVERPRGGKPRAVIGPDGTRYDKMTDAAKAEGVARNTMHGRLSREGSGWRYADEVTS